MPQLFKFLGILLAAYTLWAACNGKVYARAANWRGGRWIRQADEPRYFWVVISIYAGLSVALLTGF